jgi:hypothetical protein
MNGAMKRWTAAMLVLACGAGSSGVAYAQSGKASAEALFAEGRRLMAEGKVEAACPKFADSNKLDPSSGTLLNLGSCYEKLGRTASAWASFREAASRALSGGRADHARIAETHAAALQPTLARVTVNVETPAPGIDIRRDGVQVTEAEWGLAVPVDPGVHTYVAQAPGYAKWTTKVEVTVDAAVEAPPIVTVTIPALTALPPPPPAEPAGPRAPDTFVETGGWPARRTLAVVVAGAGVVGLGIGTVFGLTANSSYNSSLDGCPNNKNRCTPAGVHERDVARTQGDVATVAFILGGAAVATGAVLWLTAPSSESGSRRASVGLSPTPGGMTMRGQW